MAEQLSRQQQSGIQVAPATASHTGEEVDQFKVKEGSAVWMMLGITGVGKSCLSNFIIGQDNAFPESQPDNMMASVTEKATLKCSSFGNESLCVIDTPGLGDSGTVGSFESDAEDTANDYSKLATELAKVMMITSDDDNQLQGINAFLIVLAANKRDYISIKNLLNFFEIIGDYWNHSILVVTHGKALGETEEEQCAKYRKNLAGPKGPAPIKKLLNKVSNRLVIVESKDWRDQPNYHRSVVEKIMKYSKEVTERLGPFRDDLQSIGRAGFEKTKLELRHVFTDMNSPEAQAAVLQSTLKYVKDTIQKLVRIKMANGEDVDKMIEIAAAKEAELNEVSRQRDILRDKYEEQERKRIQTEENQRRADESRRIDERARRNIEVARREEERAASEKRLKEARKEAAEKEKTFNKLLKEAEEEIKKVGAAQIQAENKLQQERELTKRAAEDETKKVTAAIKRLQQQQNNADHEQQRLLQDSLQRERALQAKMLKDEKTKAELLERQLKEEREEKKRLRDHAARQQSKGFIKRTFGRSSPPP